MPQGSLDFFEALTVEYALLQQVSHVFPLKHWTHLLPFLHLSLGSWLLVQACDLFRHESGHVRESL